MMRIFIYLIAITSFINMPVLAQHLKLAGLWKTETQVLVNMEQNGNSLVAKYITPGDCVTGHNCILEKTPEYFVKGTVTPAKMELTMMRCTHDSDMRASGMSDYYTPRYTVTEFNEQEISGTWRTEYYDIEYKNDKKYFVRNEKGDEDRPFVIYRTSCKQALEELVAELERKRETLVSQREAIKEISKSSDDAINRWHQEWQEQLNEDIFHTVVPPEIKIVPGAFDQDAGSYISSWVDFLGEIAEKGGHWAGEKATRIIGLYDLIIDWGNVTVKGKVTIDEVNQVNNGLQDMHNSELMNFISYVNALKGYEALSKYCEKEIPKKDQPKLPKDPGKSVDELDKTHDEANRVLGNITAGLQSASGDFAKAKTSIKKIENLLKPHQAADQNKTMQQVMGASGIQQLKESFIEAGNHWINIFRNLQKVQEGRVKLKFLYSTSH